MQAAEMISGAGGERPKASFGFEKGNYWSNNYFNTASYAAMGLLCGAGHRPETLRIGSRCRLSRQVDSSGRPRFRQH